MTEDETRIAAQALVRNIVATGMIDDNENPALFLAGAASLIFPDLKIDWKFVGEAAAVMEAQLKVTGR